MSRVRLPRACAALLALLALALLPTFPATGSAAPSPSKEHVRVWMLNGEQFEVVRRTLPDGGTTVLPVLRALLRGPSAAEARRGVDTAIPSGARLERFTITSDGHATVELNARFMHGVPADPAARDAAAQASLSARLGQVIFTMTQFRDIDTAEVVAGGVEVVDDLERSSYDPPSRPRGARVAGRQTAPPSEASTRELQRLLAARAWLPRSAVDGRPGERTRHAVMAFQQWHGLVADGIAGPATLSRLRATGTPRALKGYEARRIEVHRAKGVALLITGGRTVRAVHVSTGMRGFETTRGVHRITRKIERDWSYPYKVWLPFASYFYGGEAFHEGVVPNVPASHGCVRVPAGEIRDVWRFATVGTQVVVR